MHQNKESPETIKIYKLFKCEINIRSKYTKCFHVKHFFIEMHIYKCYNETNKEGNEDYNEQNYSNRQSKGRCR